jgi:hypothetical protein
VASLIKYGGIRYTVRANGANQQLVRARRQVKALGKTLAHQVLAHVERQNHPALAQVFDTRVIGASGAKASCQQPRLHAVFFQHILRGSKAVEHGIGRRAGQCVAGVRVRMQKSRAPPASLQKLW